MAIKTNKTTKESSSFQKKKKKNAKHDKKTERNDKKRKPEDDNKKTSKDGEDPGTWSKSKKKRMRAMKAKVIKEQQQQQRQQLENATKENADATAVTTEQTEASSSSSSKLQNSFRARLTGSRFRSLNEELYTQESKDSFARFSKSPELFEQYHEGFRHQVESWPVNPVNLMVKWITSRYNHNKNNIVVADFGCGDAQLAKDLLQINKEKYSVHSFDLVSNNKFVTACDMANVPLENKSVDVAVFCLALMGTNLADFIREAHRVLKDDGRVKIAEVRSRIEYSHSNNKNSNKKGKEQEQQEQQQESSLTGTLKEFLQVLSTLGFECARTDKSNKMFLFLELKKNGKTPNRKLEFSAKPCIYKRR